MEDAAEDVTYMEAAKALADEAWDPIACSPEELEAAGLGELDASADLKGSSAHADVGLGGDDDAPLLPPPPLDLSPEESLTRLMRRALYPERDDSADAGTAGESKGGKHSAGDKAESESKSLLAEGGWDSGSRAAFGQHAQQLLRQRG